ncbi:MAG: alkyl hydroperoxide reductase subunit F [Bdellovibrionales bacterium]|nr:alkyl hydroperoxide reductase subunit F [Bdellovibrionales bacterium]
MIDSAMKEQLKSVFSMLTGNVILRVHPSEHADQADLESWADTLAQASSRIRVERIGGPILPAPKLEIGGEDGRFAVAFRGLPGGHEFSSLVLAILQADGKGKRPDAGIIDRIRGLKGPIKVRTYVSLTCENCPEVVQALNLMAILHPSFAHETVDGSVAQDEVNALGIQGVPAVFHEGKLVHSGKTQLIDLLSKLEETFGKSGAGQRDQDLGAFDVVVVGGGPAGASSAIYSARKGLRTAIIAERMGGQLQETKGIENMISVAYTEGARLAAQLAEHLASYPVTVLEHRRVNRIEPDPSGTRRVHLESGERIDAGAVIVATGARWRQLGIPGEKEHIGQGVAFCAHCDGPFYKGKRVAVVGGGNSGVEAAIDLAGIVEHVTLLEFGERLKADDVLVEKLRALPNARVITQAKSTRVVGDGKKVSALEYENRATGDTETLTVDGVFVQIGLLPNTHFLKEQVALTPTGEIVVDARGRTSVPGIYAAGDVTTVPFKQIIVAMGEGAKVALAAFEDRMHRPASASA